MSTFLRYLMSLVVHLAWRRTGRGGPVPPIRIPGKGKHIDLPVIGTWQLMAAVWLMKTLWERYGHDVKGHLKNNANDLARRAASYLPDPSTPPRNMTPATATPSLAPTNTMIPSPAARQYPTPPAPRPAPNLQTQVLTPQSAQNAPTAPTVAAPAQSNGAPTPLPHGSLLSKLRGRS